MSKDSMLDFNEIWAARPWWPEDTTDKELAEYYFNTGFKYRRDFVEQPSNNVDANDTKPDPDCCKEWRKFEHAEYCAVCGMALSE